MSSTVDTTSQRHSSSSSRVDIVAIDAAGRADWASALESRGYRVDFVKTVSEAASALGSFQPLALVVAGASALELGLSSLRKEAGARGVVVIDVVDDAADPLEIAAQHAEADDWIYIDRVAIELPARLARLRRRGKAAYSGSPEEVIGNARFVALVVHDLRTPLNVIGLSLRMVGQAMPKGDKDVEEDFRFIDENFKQMERMLTQLSDFCRLFEGDVSLTVDEFDPQRMIAELLGSRAIKSNAKSEAVKVAVDNSCPPAVALDPQRARLALQYALANALAAAGDQDVSIRLRGEADRWLIEIAVDRSPPPSVKSTPLRSNLFERLCGTAAERRGMDLALTARISEMFGGTARLDVQEEKGTVITIDWPARLLQAGDRS